MSTTYESAKKWIQDKNPSVEEIYDVLAKLETRIEEYDGDEINIQGSIEAATFLQAHLDNLNTTSAESSSIDLDPSPLIPDVEPIELEKSIKEETFAALKAQLGKKL